MATEAMRLSWAGAVTSFSTEVRMITSAHRLLPASAPRRAALRLA